MYWLKILSILAFFIFVIFVIFYLMDGYFLLNKVNLIMYNKKYPLSNGSEYLPTDEKWCKMLRDNYKVIRDEYIEYTKNNTLKRFGDIDQNQKSIDTTEVPWQVLMLKTYNKETNKIKYFPKTYSLIKKIPNCTLAMFSVLPPGKKLAPHRGPYNGVLRYHLSLIVPNAPKNELNGCFIKVNGKNHYWEEGLDTYFDDTYIHSAENNTYTTRVVLLLDIKKKFDNVFLDAINDILLNYSKYNSTVLNIVENTNNS
jgi:beta-hydroxylase